MYLGGCSTVPHCYPRGGAPSKTNGKKSHFLPKMNFGVQGSGGILGRKKRIFFCCCGGMIFIYGNLFSVGYTGAKAPVSPEWIAPKKHDYDIRIKNKLKKLNFAERMRKVKDVVRFYFRFSRRRYFPKPVRPSCFV